MKRILNFVLMILFLLQISGCASYSPASTLPAATSSAPTTTKVPIGKIVKLVKANGNNVEMMVDDVIVGTHFTETGDLYVTFDAQGWIRGGGDADRKFGLSFDERHPGKSVGIIAFEGRQSVTFTWENYELLMSYPGDVEIFIMPVYHYYPEWKMNG